MNDMFLDDIKKDVSVTTYTDTSTSVIHTYPDDAIITDIINCVNTAFPDTSRQQRMIYVHKIINCHRPYSDGGIVPNPLTDKDAQNYTIGFRSKLRQFAFKIYIEQLPNGIIDFIKRVQSVEKTTYQVIAIIHDRDIKLDVHGADDVSNLQCTCEACNLFKGSVLPDDFMERITEIFLYQMDKKEGKRLLWKIVHKILNKMI